MAMALEMIMKTFFLALTLCLAACGPAVEHPHPHLPTDTPRCPDACAHLRELKCDEGQPLADGTTCEAFCESTQSSGHALMPSCVVNIKKCSDMDELDSFCPNPAP
jgi:hypothetical protein